MKIGIFGGSFNPPHTGHINSMLTVAKKCGLKQIRIIPTSQNPLKAPIEGPTPAQRLEMTKLAVEGYGDIFQVDDFEINKKGASYTIDTLKELRKTTAAEDLNLIIGLDNLEVLGDWKKVDEILKETNLIVTSRPGYTIPQSVEELPEVVKKLVEEFDFNFVELKTGRHIQFVNLEDVEISGTEIRKWLRIGRSVEKYLPLAVENYIKEKSLYRPMGDRIGDYQKFCEFCAKELFSKKALNVKGFDLRNMTAPSEFALIASGTSTRHTVGLAESLMKAIKEEFNIYPQSLEGVDEGRWVLLDYGSLIVHLFYDFVRQEYSLEKLWTNGKELNIKDPFVK